MSGLDFALGLGFDVEVIEVSDLRGRPALWEDLEEGFAEVDEGRGGLKGLGGIVVVSVCYVARRFL